MNLFDGLKCLLGSGVLPGAILLVLSLFANVLSLPAQAHGTLADHIQHAIGLKVGAEHIDLTVDLTFFEVPSSRERDSMDGDADGRISNTEVAAYLKKHTPDCQKKVKLTLAGQEVPLIFLYDPEIKLDSDQAVGQAHHQLRLHFFAATPVGLLADDEIVVEDRLWPEVPSIVTQHVQGENGCALMAQVPDSTSRSGLNVNQARCFKFRIVQPPKAKTTLLRESPKSKS